MRRIAPWFGLMGCTFFFVLRPIVSIFLKFRGNADFVFMLIAGLCFVGALPAWMYLTRIQDKTLFEKVGNQINFVWILYAGFFVWVLLSFPRQS